MWKLMQDVLPQLNKIQERLDVISSKLTDNIYSKTNTEGILLGIQEDYATCLQLRIKKLRMRLEQDLNSWRNAFTAAKNEM